MNLKRLLAAWLLVGCLAACVETSSNKASVAPGWIAFDYTYTLVERYGATFEYLYRFNRYISQPTEAGRDSVDRLYFSKVKILRGDRPDTWTLSFKDSRSRDCRLIVYTGGHSLQAPHATWTVRSEHPNNYTDVQSIDTFRITVRNDGAWEVPAHTGRDVEFTDNSEWTVRFEHDDDLRIGGRGTRTSLAAPVLRLDYTITTPLYYTLRNPDLFTLTDGTLRIIATGPDNRPEETTATVTRNDRVLINYNNRHSAEVSWEASFAL